MPHHKCIVPHWHPGVSEMLIWENTAHGMQDLQKIQFFQVQQCKPSGITQTSEVDAYSYQYKLFTLIFVNILSQRVSKCFHLSSEMNESRSKKLKNPLYIVFCSVWDTFLCWSVKVKMLLNLEAVGSTCEVDTKCPFPWILLKTRVFFNIDFLQKLFNNT